MVAASLCTWMIYVLRGIHMSTLLYRVWVLIVKKFFAGALIWFPFRAIVSLSDANENIYGERDDDNDY